MNETSKELFDTCTYKEISYEQKEKSTIDTTSKDSYNNK